MADTAVARLDIGQAINQGWEKVKPDLWSFIGAIIVLGAVNIGFSMVLNGMTGISSIVVNLISFVVNAVLSIGLTKMALQALDGEVVSFSDLFSSFNNTRLLGQYILLQIVLVVIVTLGLILLIVPGIYLALKYTLAQYFLVDKEEGFSEAMSHSGEAMKGNMWRWIGFAIVLILINIVGMIPLGLGLLVTIPLTLVASVQAYRQLAGSPAKAAVKEVAAA